MGALHGGSDLAIGTVRYIDGIFGAISSVALLSVPVPGPS
jgi:hypothetical protein